MGLSQVILRLLRFTCLLPVHHWDINMASSGEGYRSVVYFANWAIYARNHTPQDLPASQLTHVMYSFGNVRPESGEVSFIFSPVSNSFRWQCQLHFTPSYQGLNSGTWNSSLLIGSYLTDKWSDTDKLYPSDKRNETGINLYGCLKQLNLLKKRNRQLKVLLSVGGMTNSTNFLPAVANDTGRAKFASTAVSLVKDHGFDGLDIDWEHPKDAQQAQDLVSLLRECRQALDIYGKSLSSPYHFELTVASSAAYYYEKMDLRGMDPYVDFWNLMAYAFAGNWSARAGHHTNLFKSKSNPNSTPFSAEEAVNYYISQGIRPSKIVLGMPTYGRAFENTDGLGDPFQGTGNGTWQNGVYDFKQLPLEGATEFYDEEAGATYSYDNQSKVLVSYDTVDMARRKACWIKKRGLGGGMWWESSADNHGEKSLVGNAVKVLGGLEGKCMEMKYNCLDYPESKYQNLKLGFPGE